MCRPRWFRPSVLVLIGLIARPCFGTDPSFAIQNIQPATNGGFAITWTTFPSSRNEVLYTDSPDHPWQSLPGTVSIADTNSYSLSYTDYPSAEILQRFYKVRITRHKIILSLVLDHSGSMLSNGGAQALPGAVASFINLFTENYDSASSSSFSQYATTDVPMETVFKNDITVTTALPFPGSLTCTECGLTNALAQMDAVVVPPGDDAIKIIVLFTDGMANTFTYNFNCGVRNISYQDQLFDPTNGNTTLFGCTIPTKLDSIDPVTGVITSGTVSSAGAAQCDDMHYEAQRRAERIAWLARSQGIFVDAIGMGSPGANLNGECSDGVFPILNPTFLQNVANTTNSATYDPSQPSGLSVVATNASQLQAVFQNIALQMLSQ